MLGAIRLRLLVLLLCVSLIALSVPAHAQSPISGGQAAGIFAILIGLGVGAGVGVYYLVRTPPSMTGCAASSPTGLQLQNEADHQTYALTGDVSGIKPGDRVRLKGKRRKDAAKNRLYFVENLSKVFGPCKTIPTTP